MLEHSPENDKLVRELHAVEKKFREATTQEEKEHYGKLASEKHNEILMREFEGDKNIGRFNTV